MEKLGIQINADTTYESVELFRRLYEKFLAEENIIKAEIFYVRSQGLVSNEDDPKTWPLQLFTSKGTRISVYNVTAGYSGNGPWAMKNILDIAGFKDTDKVFDSSNDEIELYFNK